MIDNCINKIVYKNPKILANSIDLRSDILKKKKKILALKFLHL